MPTQVYATSIVKRLIDAGYIAYFAGGWVRDFLMKRPSDDIDIATSAPVGAIQSLFPKTVPVGIAFGIVIVVEGGHSFEVATFRKESGYHDGRRPSIVEKASAEEDAERRDFTINGMFYDPLKHELLDYVGGEKDIKKGVIRAIGNPHERFAEDRLRMMRAVRYSTRFNFPIESDTLQAIIAHAKDLFPSVAIERVWQECRKMSQFSHFDTGLIILHRLGLLQRIFPELEEVSNTDIQERVKYIPGFPQKTPTIAMLLELFPHYNIQDAIKLCEYVKLSNQEKEFVTFLFHAKELIQIPWKVELYEWAKFYASPLSDLAIGIIASHHPPYEREKFLEGHTQKKHSLTEFILRLQSKSPILRSDDLRKEGIAPGKLMGELLQEAERISVNEGIESREELLARLKNTSLWKKTIP